MMTTENQPQEKFTEITGSLFADNEESLAEISSQESTKSYYERRLKMYEIFCHSDAGGDGKISQEEPRPCLRDLMKEIYAPKLKYSLFFDWDITSIITARPSPNWLQSVGEKKEKGDDFVIDVERMANPVIEKPENNISGPRDMFLGLTGQAGGSFIAYTHMAGTSPASGTTLPLKMIVASNTLAFLFLVMSFWFGIHKQNRRERITGSIGIGAAIATFLLMMGFFFA